MAARLVDRAEDWRSSSARSHVAGRRVRGEALAEAIEARLRTGRPLGTETWVVEQEAALARPLRPGRPGRKPKQRPASGK